MHNIKYYDDVTRINLSWTTLTTEMTCDYKGQEFEWSSINRRCYYKKSTSDTLRAEYLYYHELNVMNYEVTNKNFHSESDSVYIDFIQNTCLSNGSPYI